MRLRLVLILLVLAAPVSANDLFGGLVQQGDGRAVEEEEVQSLPQAPDWSNVTVQSGAEARGAYRWVHRNVVQINGEGLRTESGVNIRAIPSLETREDPHTVREPTGFSILGSEGSWIKIEVSEVLPELQTAVFPIARVSTNSSSLAMRPSPSSQSGSVRAWLPKDSRVQLLEERGNWFLVKYEGRMGFAYGRYLEPVGEQEEYWHRDLEETEGRELLELAQMRQRLENEDPPDPQLMLNYSRRMNESLGLLDISDLSTTITEIRGYLNQVADLEGSGHSELAATAQSYQEDTFYNLEVHQRSAIEALEAERLDEALIEAQIGAYKTHYSDRENLQLLHHVLQEQAEAASVESERASFLEQAAFVQRILNSEAAAPPPSVNFAEQGEEGEASDLPSQNEIDTLLAEARQLNQEGHYQAALQLGNGLIERTEGRSVRAKLFVGVQLLEMASQPQFSENASSYRDRGRIYFAEAEEGLDENLDLYPDNRRWGEAIAEYREQEPEIPLEPTEEDERVNALIDDVLERNGDRYYTQGKDRLEEMNMEIDGHSAKLRYYLALQYQILARVYDGQAARWLGQAREQIEASIELRGRYLPTYTENSLYADRSAELAAELTAAETSLPVAVDPSDQEPDTTVPMQTDGNSIVISRFEMNALTTLAILEAGARCQEEVLDVAQVVFNRIHSPPFHQDDVSEVVFAQGQFEPYFPILGRSNRSRRARIFGSVSESAAFASQRRQGLSRSMALGRIQSMEEGLRDSSKMRAARDFVGGRTFFLGANMSFNPDRGDVRRKQGCNHYKIGIRRSSVRRHRQYLEQLEAEGPLHVSARDS